MELNFAPTLLTADEVSGWLRIPKSTVYKLCKEGKIPVVKLGKHWRFDREMIERWIAVPRAGCATPAVEQAIEIEEERS